MTEIEYVITGFNEKFHTFKGNNIVLHGSRDYAEAIIEHFDNEYHFYGIMSKDPIEGDCFHGLRILSEQDISHMDIDMIILTERVKYAEEVYSSISSVCREKGILLYNMYGLDEHKIHAEIEDCEYRDTDAWEEMCRSYDIVAFEVADTLGTIVANSWFEREGEIRPVFQKLIPKLLAGGKDVRLSLRKSISEEKQISVLEESNLFPDLERRLIRRQGEDLSFRTLAQENPGKKILYIGIGLVNECILPRCYGIDTYRYIAPVLDCMAPVPDDEHVRIDYEEDLKEKVISAIEEAEVVSFDVFDTLIQRKTLFPEDVFHIVENRAKSEGLPAEQFARIRVETERTLELPTIYEIYDVLGNSCGWSTEEKEKMLNLELSAERQIIVPRTEVAELLMYAVRQGKTVVLTSDMYLPEPLLNRILAENGIQGYNSIFISCDVKKTKHNGLYECLFSLCEDSRKILHIGDNIQADGNSCDKYGIKSIILPSALVMACAGNWLRSVRCAESLMERCLVGMAVSELFRDPFRNPNLKEVSQKERLRRFAAGVTGPLVTGYMTWLIQRIRENEIDKVLFFSRDGYMPERIYRGIMLEPPLPPSVYFHANRHAAFLTCADDLEMMNRIISTGRWSGMKGMDLLQDVYGMADEEILRPYDGETAEELIKRNMPKIREMAARARNGYKTYAKKCGLEEGENCAVVDFIAAGTTQAFLEKALPLELKGYYFGSYERNKTSETEVYLKGDNPALLTNYIEVESFFSAAEPSVERITEEGGVEFQEEMRSRQEIEDLQYVLDRSEQFAESFFALFYEEGNVIRPVLPEEMYAADGYHWVQQTAYEDWFKKKIKTRTWRNGRR